MACASAPGSSRSSASRWTLSSRGTSGPRSGRTDHLGEARAQLARMQRLQVLVSETTLRGCGTRRSVLAAGWFTPVLPPTAESTCASRVSAPARSRRRAGSRPRRSRHVAHHPSAERDHARVTVHAALDQRIEHLSQRLQRLVLLAVRRSTARDSLAAQSLLDLCEIQRGDRGCSRPRARPARPPPRRAAPRRPAARARSGSGAALAELDAPISPSAVPGLRQPPHDLLHHRTDLASVGVDDQVAASSTGGAHLHQALEGAERVVVAEQHGRWPLRRVRANCCFTEVRRYTTQPRLRSLSRLAGSSTAPPPVETSTRDRPVSASSASRSRSRKPASPSFSKM